MATFCFCSSWFDYNSPELASLQHKFLKSFGMSPATSFKSRIPSNSSSDSNCHSTLSTVTLNVNTVNLNLDNEILFSSAPKLLHMSMMGRRIYSATRDSKSLKSMEGRVKDSTRHNRTRLGFCTGRQLWSKQTFQYNRTKT